MIRLCFVVEVTTDVRMVNGLASTFDLTLLGRSSVGKKISNHPPSFPYKEVFLPGNRFGFGWAVFRHLLAHASDYDFVMVAQYGVAALGVNLASRWTGVPSAMLVCSPSEAYYACRKSNPVAGKTYSPLGAAALRTFARLNALAGTRYITLSDHLSSVVQRDAPRAKVMSVPIYGVNTEGYHPADRPKQQLRAELNLPLDAELIIFSSRIAPEKDSHTLLQAVALLAQRGRRVMILNASGGFQAMKDAAEQYGVGDQVIAVPPVNPVTQLPKFYQAADLCVQASREEGLGFSVLEALACEVPVVATHVGGLRETILEGQTGWTYRMGDADSLANAISAGLSDKAEAACRAKNGRAMVMERYESAAAFERLRQWIASEIVPGRR